MRDTEFEKRKKTIEDLKAKLDDIKKKTEDYSTKSFDDEDMKISRNKTTERDKEEREFRRRTSKNNFTRKVNDETMMMPRSTIKKTEDKVSKLIKNKEDELNDTKILPQKEVLDPKEERQRRREERLKEKREKEKDLKERAKEDKKIKEKKIEERCKKGEKIPFRELSGKQKTKVVFKNIILAFIFIMIIGIGLLYGYIYGLFGNDMGIEKSLLEGAPQTSIVYDKEGKEIARLSDDERRTIIKLNEMGEFIPNAYISIEDQRFNDHPGIDIKRTAGAVFNYVVRRKSTYGGSTITQQLVKNMTKDKERSASRKVRELSRALQLEQRMSKDEILELYLNLIFVGGDNVYGIALASDYYFAKKADELTLEEAAYLAGINHSPGNYNPYIEKGHHLDENGAVVVDDQKKYDEYLKMYEKINKRTLTVLAKMKELGKITDEQYAKAKENVEKGIKFKKGTLAYSTYEYSYHTDAAIEEAVDAIAEKRKVDRNIAKLMLIRGGYHIYTTQDSNIQKQVEESMSTKKYTLLSHEHKDENGKPFKSQAVTTILDHKTGEIIAAVGGLEDKVRMKRGDWNRVTRTIRQPGSSIKPLVVTAPGLESGKITLGHTFDDTPYEKGGWKPQNFSRTFSGRTTVRKALVKSLNIPQIRQLEIITPKYATEFLRKMDFPIDDRDENNLAIALGGFTSGVTTINMASGFGMIANDGEYIQPTFLVKLEDNNRETIFKPEQKRERVMSKENAFLLKDVLKGSTNPGELAAIGAVPGFDVGSKTGTTDNFKDSYYCTFSNIYTAATWYGFDKAESFNNINAGYYNPSMELLSGIFKNIHQGKTGSRFVKPENIIQSTVLFNEFKLAPAGLTSGTLTELFVKGTEPKEVSSDYITVKVCKKSGKLATDDCDPSDVEEKTFRKGEEPTEYCTVCKSEKKANEEKINAEVQKVINVYNSLGNISGYTAENKSALENAKNMYEALSPGAKAKISEGIKTKYNQVVAQLKKIAEDVGINAANAVIEKINAIPVEITKTNLVVAKSKANTARMAYNALTPNAKNLVTNYSTLTSAEAKIKALETTTE